MSRIWSVSYVLTLLSFSQRSGALPDLHSFPTRRSSDLGFQDRRIQPLCHPSRPARMLRTLSQALHWHPDSRSEEHTSELQSRRDLVCRLLLEKKKRDRRDPTEDKEWRCASGVVTVVCSR